VTASVTLAPELLLRNGLGVSVRTVTLDDEPAILGAVTAAAP
jgi:hypothetical protein